jgi:hypothetical protein
MLGALSLFQVCPWAETGQLGLGASKNGLRHRIFVNKFPKVLRAAVFSDIIVGFAYQKA